MVTQHRAPGARPATTLDLYRELQAVTPDTLAYLLHDLFEVKPSGSSTRNGRRRKKPRTVAGAWRVT